MTSTLRAIARFWFLATLLLVLTVAQLGLKPPSPAGPSSLALVPEREPAAGLLGTPTASAQPPTGTPTPSSTPTVTPTPTATSTSSPTPSATATVPDTPTPAPSATATATSTPSPSPSPTFTPTPFPTPDGSVRTANVPILMYHYISVPPAGADVYRRDLSVKPAEFEAQLAWLRSQGYQGIRLADLVYYLTQGRPLPDKPIILTFDDGYRDAYTNAFPLLLKYGYVGTFFLITRPIDDQDPAYLSWDMVKEMHQAGMDLEPHGYRHNDLRGQNVDFLVYEIVGSKEAIEARTGETCRFFAYPSGSYDRQTIAVLRSAYFWGAVITDQGATHRSDHPFELKRIRVRGRFTVQDFADLFTYNW